MLTLKVIFSILFAIDCILSIWGAIALNKTTKAKIETTEYLGVILTMLGSFFLFWLQPKIYFLIGIGLSSLVLVLFLLDDLNEEHSIRISFSNKAIIGILTMFFWSQVIGANYLVIRNSN